MKVLIVGLGSIARKHIAALRELFKERLEITALRSRPNAENEEGIKNIYDWEELISLPDFVLISNPTVLHVEAIEKALQLKVPLFIEKPVLADLAKAEHLDALIKESGVQTYVACNLRFHEPIIQLRSILNSGKYGKVNEVNVYCGSDLSKWRTNVDFRQTYSASAKLGGGVHLDLIHELDYMYWFFGMPEQVQSHRRSNSHLDIDAIDYANYQMIYPGFTASVILNYYRQDYKRQIEVLTSEGTLLCDLKENTIHYGDEMVYHNDQLGFIDTYKKQMKYFIDAIQEGRKIENDFNEGVAVLKIALS